jgi:hypothetical protein
VHALPLSAIEQRDNARITKLETQTLMMAKAFDAIINAATTLGPAVQPSKRTPKAPVPRVRRAAVSVQAHPRDRGRGGHHTDREFAAFWLALGAPHGNDSI